MMPEQILPPLILHSEEPGGHAVRGCWDCYRPCASAASSESTSRSVSVMPRTRRYTHLALFQRVCEAVVRVQALE